MLRLLVVEGNTPAGRRRIAESAGATPAESYAGVLRGTASELESLRPSACLCSNRTCEIGLQQATGRPYGSFVLLLERLTAAG